MREWNFKPISDPSLPTDGTTSCSSKVWLILVKNISIINHSGARHPVQKRKWLLHGCVLLSRRKPQGQPVSRGCEQEVMSLGALWRIFLRGRLSRDYINNNKNNTGREQERLADNWPRQRLWLLVKGKSNEAARVDKSKLDKYSSSFKAASSKYKDNTKLCVWVLKEENDCSRHNIPKKFWWLLRAERVELVLHLACKSNDFFRFCIFFQKTQNTVWMNNRNGNKPGYGDHNNGFGLMQVKKKFLKNYGWRSTVPKSNIGQQNSLPKFWWFL